MFSLLARILQKLSKKKWAVSAVCIVFTLLCIYPVNHLRWELQLEDMLPKQQEQHAALWEKSLSNVLPVSVIIEGPDSLRNIEFAQKISERLNENPLVRFSAYSYHSDLYEFFMQNRLLYLSSAELNAVYQKLILTKEKLEQVSNPFLVELLNESSSELSRETYSAVWDKLKNPTEIQDIYQNANGTIRVVDVFPQKETALLSNARQFVSLVKRTVDSLQKDFPDYVGKVHYSGKILQVASTGNTLLPEAKKAGVFTAILIAVFLLCLFIRQPQLILPSGLPIALSVFWTLGIAYFLYGRICLVSFLITLILPGLAAQHTVHIFRRYFEESSKGLSPELSLESALLGIAPVAAASAAATSALFFSLSFVPYAGLHELGVLGTIGSILNWILCGTLTPAILRLLQKKKTFAILGGVHPERIRTEEIKLFRPTKKLAALLVALTLIFAAQGIYPKFHYNFAKTEFQNPSRADTLLHDLHHDFNAPAVVLLPSENAVENYLERFRQGQAEGKFKSIERIVSPNALLPQNQSYKLQILKNIRAVLNEPIFKNITGKDSVLLEKLKMGSQAKGFSKNEIPSSVFKYISIPETSERPLIIFPSASIEDGLFCRAFARDLNELANNNVYPSTGLALTRADTLNSVLPHLFKSIIFAVAAIFVILLIYYNKFSYTLFTLAPPITAFIWILSFLKFFHIELSVYSALAFPLLIGMSLDGSLHFWNYYFSKQNGSAIVILQRFGFSIAISQIMAMIGMLSLLVLSHPGLKSIAQISILGIVCIGLANFFIFPLMAASLDAYRLRKAKGT